MASAEEEIYSERNTESSADDVVVHIIQDKKDAPQHKFETSRYSTNNDSDDKELKFWVPAMLMDPQRITVTQEELQRRIGAPECLSRTMLLSLLRLSKDKGPELKQTLARSGMGKLTSKSAIISCFTKLTEREAAQLAEDYFYLASRHLRLKEINNEIVEARGGQEKFEPQAKMTQELLQDILAQIEARDTDLTLMTHGFSPLIIRAVIDILIEIITYKKPM